MMREPFKGTINVGIRYSVPDWSPFESASRSAREAEAMLVRE